MGFLDFVRRLLGAGTQFEGRVALGPQTFSRVLDMPADELYRTQPHLRTVISFLARNIAQLSLHSFARVGDNDRRRVHDDPLTRALARPNPATTNYELFGALVGSMKLYDVAIWALVPDPDYGGQWQIWPIPIGWVTATGGGSAWAPQWLDISRPKSGVPFDAPSPWPGKPVRLENNPGEDLQFLLFHGWDPVDPSTGSSPVDSLRQILAEQIQAWQFREQVWQRGGRVGTTITRPAGAPLWSDQARTKFARDWAAKWTGPDGAKAGGTPILEDGMELKPVRFNAREEEWVEAAKLSLSTVAAVYHTSPTMVGVLDNANFSNIREFSRMLYTDTLGPDLAMIKARINHFLVPMMSRIDGMYVEFNVAEKLQGSFEEQAAVVSTSVGRPWMTADEARGRFNLPALGGNAAELVTPLNVLVGGQASPRDTGSQNRNTAPIPLTTGALRMFAELAATHPDLAKAIITRDDEAAPLRIKSEPDAQDEAAARQVLSRFFARQRSQVLKRLGAKADDPDWWDGDRWDRELADDLYALAMTVTARLAKATLDDIGLAPDLYDPDRTAKFLRAVATSRAGAINATTRDQITAALAGDLGDDAERSTPGGVFDQAEGSRSDTAARTLATTLAAFAVVEVAHQLGRPKTTKTWVVTSSKPRASHAAMDGQTVPVDEPFGNGMNWPGDPSGGVDEVAGCSCAVELTIP